MVFLLISDSCTGFIELFLVIAHPYVADYLWYVYQVGHPAINGGGTALN